MIINHTMMRVGKSLIESQANKPKSLTWGYQQVYVTTSIVRMLNRETRE